MRKSVWAVFWALVAVVVITVGAMFVPPLAGLEAGINTFAAWPVILGLGIALIVLTIKTKVSGKPRAFLILTGAAAVGLPAFAILHNVVYGLLTTWFGADFFGPDGDEPVCFILATIVCPLGFLVGAIGTIVLAVRHKSKTKHAVEGG